MSLSERAVESAHNESEAIENTVIESGATDECGVTTFHACNGVFVCDRDVISKLFLSSFQVLFLTGLLRSELHPHKPDLAAVCIKSPPDEEVARSGTPEDFVRATVVRVRTERSLNRYLFFPICASQNGSEVRFCGGGGVG